MEVAGGTNLDSSLTARNDHGSHWLLEPSKEMSFSEYKASSTALNATYVDDPKPEKSLNIQLPRSIRQSFQGYPIPIRSIARCCGRKSPHQRLG